MAKIVLTLACAATLLLACAEAPAAVQGGTTSAEAEGAQTPSPAENDSGPVSLAELTRDGLELRATDFIPAEAVTRQSGRVTSDAVVVTLQKTSSTRFAFTR